MNNNKIKSMIINKRHAITEFHCCNFFNICVPFIIFHESFNYHTTQILWLDIAMMKYIRIPWLPNELMKLHWLLTHDQWSWWPYSKWFWLITHIALRSSVILLLPGNILLSNCSTHTNQKRKHDYLFQDNHSSFSMININKAFEKS